jgi:NAD(P)-dependent dehydrogenase (short-subunit alcohol dehydrogenase family)
MAREGAKIAVNDIVPQVAEETAQFLKSRGYDAIAIAGNASVEDDVKKLINQAEDHYGKIDILFNLAGQQFRWAVWDINLPDWDRQLRTYLTSGMLTTKYAARSMISKKVRGSIIHVISDAGLRGEPGNSGYSAAKAGLLRFSEAAAMDLAQFGIRVNSLSPCAMEHNMFRAFGAAGRQVRNRLQVTRLDTLQSIPLGRYCRSSDLAAAAVFLASDDASFITAVNIPLDGGMLRAYAPYRPWAHLDLTQDKYRTLVTPQKYGEPASAPFPVQDWEQTLDFVPPDISNV